MRSFSLLPITQAQVPGAPEDADSGTGTDSYSQSGFTATGITSDDTATSTESGSLYFTGSETGTSTETGSIVFTGADTGTATDAGLVVRSAGDTNITTTEVGVVGAVSYAGSDTGEGTDESTATDYGTMLPSGILRNKWFGEEQAKWNSVATNRWRSRLVTNGDQIS